MSLGAKLAGIDVTVAVDSNPDVAATYRRNFPTAAFLQSDIVSISADDLPVSKIDVLLAGPPCQSFSTSNQRTRGDDNPLNNLLYEPLRFARDLRPSLVVIENVAGLGIGTRRRYLESLMRRLTRLGYFVTCMEVDGSQCGIPQRRRRLFVVGSTKPFGRLGIRQNSQPTVRDAIGDLPHLDNGNSIDELPYGNGPYSRYAAKLRQRSVLACDGHTVTSNSDDVISRFKHVRPGGNWRDIPRALMTSYSNVDRSHTGIYHRLHWDEPSKVIGNFRKNMLIHPDEQRGLSIREAARLQSFPDHFCFSGSIGKRQQQVGNAVPPLMARSVLSMLIRNMQ